MERVYKQAVEGYHNGHFNPAKYLSANSIEFSAAVATPTPDKHITGLI
jgi:hypothetical protein